MKQLKDKCSHLLDNLFHSFAQTTGDIASNKAHNSISSYNTIAGLLPYHAYDSQYDLYINQHSQGFILEVAPLTCCDEGTVKVLTTMITDSVPENCVLTFTNWASPNVAPLIDRWVEPRLRAGDIYKKLANKRKEFLLNGIFKSIFADPYTIKNFRVLISAGIPDLSKQGAQQLLRFRKTLISALRTIGMLSRPEPFPPECLINWLNEIINPTQELQRDYLTYDKLNPINTQIANRENYVTIEKDGLLFAKEQIMARTFSVCNYPETWAQWQCNELIGSMTSNTLRMGCPFLTSFSLVIQDESKQTAKATLKAARFMQQAGTAIARYMPEVKTQAGEWTYVVDKIKSGQKLVQTVYSVTIFDSKDNIYNSEQSLKALYKKSGWLLQRDDCIQLISYLGALPFTLADGLQHDFLILEKFKNMVSWTCANLLPIQGEWKGMQSPGVLLLGRRGQPFFWNPFANTEGNYNVIVVGKPGAGKSVFLQELMSALRGLGSYVYVIDDGRSSMNSCLLQGGKFAAFGNGDGICLNPFSLVDEKTFATNSEYKAEILNLLVNITIVMCFDRGSADDFQRSIIEEAVMFVWQKYGIKGSITDVRDYLKKQADKRVQDLAVQLTSFCKKGKYGDYFNGTCNLEVDSPFMVFEMAELKSKPELQKIVMLILMFILSEKMYFGNRQHNIALVIDEAWALLASGDAIANFMEGFVRRARKYGGSLITGTQSINDYYQTAAAKAAMENSDWTCLLAQKVESIEQLKKDKRISMDDNLETLLKSVRMSDKEYAEVMIRSASGSYVIGRIIVDAFALAVYSSKASDFKRIQDLQQQGYSLVEAIEISANQVRDN